MHTRLHKRDNPAHPNPTPTYFLIEAFLFHRTIIPSATIVQASAIGGSNNDSEYLLYRVIGSLARKTTGQMKSWQRRCQKRRLVVRIRLKSKQVNWE